MAAIMRQMRKQILTIAWLTAALVVALLLTIPAPSQAAGLVERIVSDPLTGVALEGYDPVSYFTDSQPVPGKPDFSTEWQGVPWYFASAANRDAFKLHPEIYAPQYGGHCAMSVGRGYASEGRPKLFLIDRAKLYLFYSAANREAFLASRRVAEARADANWTRLLATLTGPQQRVDAPIKAAFAE